MLEKEVLASIYDDMENNRLDLDRVKSSHNRKNEMEQEFFKSTTESLEVQFYESLEDIGGLVGISTFTPFDGFLSSENLRLIGEY